MSCVLSIAGKKLDTDDFILKIRLKGFIKKYKEKNIKSKYNRLEQKYSFVSATISKASLNNFKKQVSDTIAYLKKNKKKLVLIKNTKEIEYATLNFLVKSKSVSDEYFAQYLYFPRELTLLCGSLNLGIEITIV